MRPSENGGVSLVRLTPTAFAANLLDLAIDGSDSDVLDILVQSKCDKNSAKKFFRKLLKELRYVPRMIVTDKLKT